MNTTLVFVPGLLNTNQLWNYQVKKLRKKINIISFDTTKDNNFKDMIERNLYNIEGDFIIIGMSMGGYIALEAYEMIPNRIKGLALFNTGAEKSTDDDIKKRNKIISTISKNNFIGMSKKLIDELLSKKNRDNQYIRTLIKEMAINLGPDVFIRQTQAIIKRTDKLNMLKKINIPVMLVGGMEDIKTPYKYMEKMDELIINSKLTLLKNCGHLSPLEEPEKTYEIILNLVKTSR